MEDRPYLTAFAAILAVIVAFYGYSVFFGGTASNDVGDVTLEESPIVDSGYDIEEIKIKKGSGFFLKRMDYKQRRSIRERAFRNFMVKHEDKQEVSRKMSDDQRRLKRAMGGIGARKYEEALTAISQKRYEEAIGLFISAIKAEPNNIVIRLLTFKRMAQIYKLLKYERRYCVAMIKYLDLLEKYEADPNSQDQIRNYKREIEEKLRTL